MLASGFDIGPIPWPHVNVQTVCQMVGSPQILLCMNLSQNLQTRHSSAWGRVRLNLIPAQPSSSFDILPQAAILIHTSVGTEICEADKT